MPFPFRKASALPAGATAALPDAVDTTAVDTADEPADLRPVNTAASEDGEYPSGLKLGLLLASVFISMFLVALDRLIIATAIPQITDDFHSVEDIGWYGSSYLLATCALQLMSGKAYMYWSIKTVFLSAVLLFEIGSAVCGAAPSSVAFIIGRAISGVGAAGIFSGVVSFFSCLPRFAHSIILPRLTYRS